MPETKDADKLDAQHVAIQRNLRECVCGNYVNATTGETTGCDEDTTRTFAPGHDAKLKSFFVRCYMNGHKVRKLGSTEELSGLEISRDFDWSVQVAKSIDIQTRKLLRRNDMHRAVGQESRETKAVFRALQRNAPGTYEPIGGTFGKDREAYELFAKQWLGDKSELSERSITKADWDAIYDWFVKGM